MSDLFSDFASLGLGGLEATNLFEEPEKAPVVKPVPEVREVKQLGEKEMVFDKSYTCPICEGNFKNKTIRTGKNRLLRIDRDLRQVYTPVDQVKYDVVACPNCGYAALERYFPMLTRMQKEGITRLICASYQQQTWGEEYYTYEDARKRYQLALANAMAKMAKSSEKAYICLKLAWVLRGERDVLDKNAPDYEQMKRDNEKAELEALENAFEGFVQARKNETYPMCGMDEPTTDYLVGALAFEIGNYEVASKMVSTVLASHSANSRIKDKTRDLKEEIIEAIRTGRRAI